MKSQKENFIYIIYIYIYNIYNLFFACKNGGNRTVATVATVAEPIIVCHITPISVLYQQHINLLSTHCKIARFYMFL